MAGLEIGLLIGLGLLLLVIEVFLTPGVSVAGMVALGFFGWAVWKAFLISPVWGVGVAILAVALIVGAVYLLTRSKMLGRMALKTEIKGSAREETHLSEGDKGVTISRMAPRGKVRFANGVEAECVAAGGFLDEGIRVEVSRARKGETPVVDVVV